MKFWVGVTDKDWFDFLSARQPDEVNFWQPSAKPLTRALVPGTPFLFKLHSPHNYVVGGGFFVRFTVLPVSVAWAAFGDRNGAGGQAQLLARLQKLARTGVTSGAAIGCNILTEPFFLDETDWIPIPEDWAANIVRGKTYDTAEAHGAALWAEIDRRLVAIKVPDAAWQAEGYPLYGADYLAHARLGQGAFRILVTDAYRRRCAITQERTLPALEAAHIKAYSESGPNRVCNGLLLRSDLHRLFDVGYVTVTSGLKVEVSKRIKEEFENGREYYRYHGRSLENLPAATRERPSPEFIEWHNQKVFVG
ncbi:MAG: HNH endonuclease [Gammaproteobacteria bacterium]|nr:HNH endonuclease [Gammaproteobacteria bacterium]NIR83760.1 HNH endonuclease [Gammaproteobacteria bacterium]NIR88118.1 HNH endonuclease [Gammaproteobacteria bacterium]NIU05077.1 HNH endonuclease [Gammaproteobacteria bacterium]NIV51920.1 HNH endonuclease [Gammaproteobacteria bacterium]